MRLRDGTSVSYLRQHKYNTRTCLMLIDGHASRTHHGRFPHRETVSTNSQGRQNIFDIFLCEISCVVQKTALQDSEGGTEREHSSMRTHSQNSKGECQKSVHNFIPQK